MKIVAPGKVYTLEAYLEREERSESKHEYAYGNIYEIPGVQRYTI